MFQRWLSYQQPLWLVGALLMIGVAFESQAPYWKTSKLFQQAGRDEIQQAEIGESSLNLTVQSR